MTGFQKPARFMITFYQHWIALVIIIFFFRYDHCCAVKTKFGLSGSLSDIELDELVRTLTDIGENIVPKEVTSESSHYAGTLNTLRYSFTNGLRMVVRLLVVDPNTCNLGMGSEVSSPMVPVSGNTIIDIANRMTIPTITTLIERGLGYGETIEEGVSMDYFVASDSEAELSNPSDDEPADHDHSTDDDEGGDEGASGDLIKMNPYTIPSKLNRSMDTGGRGNDLNISRSHFSSLASTTLNVSDHRRLKGMGTVPGGRTPLASNVTNNSTSATFPQRKFPIDPDGDCDLPSLILMTSTGPYYDDQATHGLQVLNPTDKIWSPNARFYLVMQADCNLVLYDVQTNTALWASGTDGLGSVCYCTISTGGELIVYDKELVEENVLWRTLTWCKAYNGRCWTNAILQVQDDGNAVLYILSSLYVLWASNTVQCEGGCTD